MSDYHAEETSSSGAGAPPAANGDDTSPAQEKKTKRIQLSCTSCRHRKLKCNRIQPCENCIKRGQAGSCYFANPGPRKTPAQARLSARNNELQQRLMHLEELVVSLQNKNDGAPEAAVAAIEARGTSSNRRDGGVMDSDVQYPGRMVTDKFGTRYVDAVHWQAMLDEVKEYIGTEDEDDEDENYARYNGESDEPPRLLGAIAAATKNDLLTGLPSRPIVDLLVKRWFQCREPALISIHVPTFMNEYDRFWKDPRNASPAYLSILYSIVWLGTAFYVRTGEEPPSDRASDPTASLDFYLTKAAQGLILSDYTKPGKHKIEALLLYFSAEYLRHRDAQVGISFLISIIVKVAMHAGIHRDPKHFPEMTPFDSEMRRRRWMLILQLDTLIAFQVGLPRTIHDWQCDTGPPKNLQDEDLFVAMKEIPPQRPESERTPVTYQVVKSRLMSVFGTISDRAYSRERMTYDEIMLLDMRLREAYDSLPQWLKVRPLNLCLTDPPEVVMQRFNLQFLYHKGRCILHRRCFSGAITDPRCLYSKRICVESAIEILKKQKEIHDATKKDGVLRHDSWYLSSLTTHDFILAAMVVCLWLSREQTNSNPAHLDALEALRAQPNSVDLFKTLEDSYKIWRALKEDSYEAYKASQALAVMLGKTRARAENPVDLNEGISRDFAARVDMNGSGGGKAAASSTAATTAASHPSSASVDSPDNSGSQGSQNSNSPAQQRDTPDSDLNVDDGMAYDLTSFDPSAFGAVSENLLDAPLDLDWDTWDQQYRLGKNGMDLMDTTNMDWANDPAFQNFDMNNVNMPPM